MKKTIFFTVMAMLCLNFYMTEQVKTQEISKAFPEQPITPFRQGEKLPESFWQQEHTVYADGKVSRQNLSAYKNKILVLDFWATWCGSCIRHLAEADSLQKKYEGQVAIVLVNCTNTGDTPLKVEQMMKKSGSHLKSITADSVLTKQFPHRLVPHYIWIANNTFTAATGSEFINSGNIDVLLTAQQKILEARKRHEMSITKKP